MAAIPAPAPTVESELDRVTLERCRRQDHAAFRLFVGRYERAVFAVISRMLGRGQRALVEELAQETFVRAFSAFPRFDPHREAKVSTWLLTIATRLAIDHQRKHSTWREIASDEPPEVGAAPTALSQLEADDLQAAYEAAVIELPPEYRAAFVLRTYHEQSYEQIAAALQIEIGTVKSRLARAKRRISDAIEEAK